ncbi:hypothetical protein E4U43_004830 [Claviceps pusilla]|uniref:Anaphase-promoting complex subunit 2 n=1 Tax=Claviceps pusilla TaxID=123648 RepID=A0A9P7STQ2_9HYPO|nr:hypothetical protein E4U43_004830 [Claviceps pusilla]
MTASRIRTRKNKVLRSVFQTDASQPSPLLAPTGPGEAFDRPPASSVVSSSSSSSSKSTSSTRQGNSHGHVHGHAGVSSLHPAADQVRWDRAWHIVTSRIQLPTSVTVEDSFGTLPPESQHGDSSFYDSLAVVLDASTAVPRAAHTEDILSWHTQQVRQHFGHHVLPLLAACAVQGDHAQVLLSSVQTLEAAHRQYLYVLTTIVRGIKDESVRQRTVDKFKSELHAIIGNSWARGLTEALHAVMRRLLGEVLGPPKRAAAAAAARTTTAAAALGADDDVDQHRRVTVARNELLALLESLRNVGLAGDKFQILFAEIMDSCMNDFIHKTYTGVWSSMNADGSVNPSASSGCMPHLCDWVENHYGHLAVEALGRLGRQVAWTDVERWRDIAIGRLASLRMHELFDIVLHWPESRGGLEDLRTAVATPQRRLHLTDTFAASLQKRLLHPGRSTLEILQTYISMIRTFHQLDSSKVLLDRVVHALQLYLCQRDDAIRIVVTGLLSNPGSMQTDEGNTRLVELAVMMNEASQQQRVHVEDEDLDWDDMTWVPDPVDAGPNYKRPKNEDVAGTLINALGSQEIFIKEFQMIMAERLLSKQTSFQQEIKVLSLLKKRFGESALQNCDVMVKDIYDSKRVDALLRKSLRLRGADVRDVRHVRQQNLIRYHAKILSRLFWPSLPKEPFTVPGPVADIQGQYEAGFEQLKTSRKLAWLDHIGSATVQLDLKDRSCEVECKTYEAAVIYAFQNDENNDNVNDDDDDVDVDDYHDAEPQQRTFNQLWETLMMDEDLLQSALHFWVSKRVLRDLGNQTYVVLERLDDQDEAGHAGYHQDASSSVANATELAQQPQQPQQQQESSPRRTKMNPKEQERRTVYWQFIVGMLTNSSPAMPLGQIAMMMKMLIPDGGCSWNNEELQEFLAEKVADAELELSGGKYRLPKK